MKNKRGITLIALIITIIVLLILAGVTITSIVSENGIIAKARKAKIDKEISENRERLEMMLSAAKTSSIVSNASVLEEFKNEFNKDEFFKKASASEISNNEIIITTKEGYVFKVTETAVTYSGKDGENVEKLKVTLAKDPLDPDFACYDGQTITLNIGSDYRDFFEYWVCEKIDLATRERMVCIIYEVNTHNLKQGLLDAKTNGYTISEACYNKFHTTLEDAIYDTYQDNIYLAQAAVAIVLIPENERIEKIVEAWNQSHTSNAISSIDDLIKIELGEDADLQSAANDYGCSMDIIIDYAFLHNVMLNSSFNLWQYITQANEEERSVITEYDNIVNAENNDVTVKLPDNTIKTYSGPIRFTAKDNGTYKFYVTYKGKETEYSIDVSGLGHSQLGEYADDYTPVVIDDKEHIAYYYCYGCSQIVEVRENHKDNGEINIDGDYISENPDGKCDYCGAQIN